MLCALPSRYTNSRALSRARRVYPRPEDDKSQRFTVVEGRRLVANGMCLTAVPGNDDYDHLVLQRCKNTTAQLWVDHVVPWGPIPSGCATIQMNLGPRSAPSCITTPGRAVRGAETGSLRLGYCERDNVDAVIAQLWCLDWHVKDTERCVTA